MAAVGAHIPADRPRHATHGSSPGENFCLPAPDLIGPMTQGNKTAPRVRGLIR